MVNDDDAGLAFAQLQAVSAEQKTPGRTHDKLCELQPGDFDYDKIRSEHLSPDDHDAVPRDAIEHSVRKRVARVCTDILWLNNARVRAL